MDRNEYRYTGWDGLERIQWMAAWSGYSVWRLVWRLGTNTLDGGGLYLGLRGAGYCGFSARSQVAARAEIGERRDENQAQGITVTSSLKRRERDSTS